MIYVVKYLSFSYDDAESDIVSICDSRDKAFKCAISSLVKKASDNCSYDPRERYYSSINYGYGDKKDTINHRDNWECMTQCSNYTIEEWDLNNENGNKLKTWNINFDKAVKTCIIENKIMPKMVNTFIKSLETQLDTINYCMVEEKEEFGLPWAKRKEPVDDVVLKWNKFYGKKPDERTGF